jgi:hypothetical protein
MEEHMESLKFDAMIFGNGLTLNLFGKLMDFVPNEKRYLFNIDEFLKKLISNKLPFKEEKYIEIIFYNKTSIENNKNFLKLKNILSEYYSNNNSNIEKVLGKDLFKKENEVGYNIAAIKDLFPALYNIWFDMVYQYIINNDLEVYLENFYTDVKSLLSSENDIYTTNFDYLSDKYMKTKHIHGKFIDKISTYSDVILYVNDDKSFEFKMIWGYNGVGKEFMLNSYYRSGKYEKNFDFNFLYKEIIAENILIYGMSFQRAGYIDDEFLKNYSKYNNDNFEGTVIDDHILKRVSKLQELKKIKNVTVSYYSEKERNYFEEIFKYYKIKNFEFIKSSQFEFKIN